jgi:hypothetical protein
MEGWWIFFMTAGFQKVRESILMSAGSLKAGGFLMPLAYGRSVDLL